MSRISYFDHRRLLAPVAALALLATPVAASNNDPHGTWLRPEGGEQFSFYDCGAQLCAKLVAVAKTSDQGAIGTVILRNAVKSGANEWKGKLFNTDDGKTYDGIITVDANELHLKGCLWGMLCSGETWKRVASAAGASSAPKAHNAAPAPVKAPPKHAMAAAPAQ